MLICTNMKQKIQEAIDVPSDIIVNCDRKKIICKKDLLELSRDLNIPSASVIIEAGKINIIVEKASKIELTRIKTLIAHIKNMFAGLHKPFIYVLEACNVHFPMNFKLEKDRIIINNFLGEKVSRLAIIEPNVKVEIKGTKIILTSHDLEAAGRTASNIERATKIKNRDRRIFQDGIFIVERPSQGGDEV